MSKVKSVFLATLPTIVDLIISNIIAVVFAIFVIVIYMIGNPELVMKLSSEEMMEMLLPKITLPITIACNVIVFVIAMLVFKLGMKDESWGFTNKAFPDYTLPGTILLAIGIYPVVNLIMAIQGVLFPDAMESYVDLINSSGLGELSAASFIGAVICAPFGEELIHRGITLRILEDGDVGFAAANVIQAVLFGIAHMNIIQGIYAAVIGLVLGYIYHRTGSLWASILAHLTFNLLGLYLTELMNLFDDQIWFLLMIWTMCVVSLILGIFLMKIRIRRRRHNR